MKKKNPPSRIALRTNVFIENSDTPGLFYQVALTKDEQRAVNMFIVFQHKGPIKCFSVPYEMEEIKRKPLKIKSSR